MTKDSEPNSKHQELISPVNILTYIPRPLRTTLFAWGAASITALATLPGCSAVDEYMNPINHKPTREPAIPIAEVAAVTKIAPTSMPIEKPGPSLINCVGFKEIDTNLQNTFLVSIDRNARCWHYDSLLGYSVDIPTNYVLGTRRGPKDPDIVFDDYTDNIGNKHIFIGRFSAKEKNADTLIAEGKTEIEQSLKDLIAPNFPFPPISSNSQPIDGKRAVEYTFTLPGNQTIAIFKDRPWCKLTAIIPLGNTYLGIGATTDNGFEDVRNMIKSLKIQA